jgi:hypothetical protein
MPVPGGGNYDWQPADLQAGNGRTGGLPTSRTECRFSPRLAWGPIPSSSTGWCAMRTRTNC